MMAITINGKVIETPEHDKLEALGGENQIVGAFVEWLLDRYDICAYDEEMLEFLPTRSTIEALLGEYYGISRDEVEREKMAMLAAIRSEP